MSELVKPKRINVPSGMVVLTGDFFSSCCNEGLANKQRNEIAPNGAEVIIIGDWCAIAMFAPLNRGNQIFRGEEGVSAIFSGYLVNIRDLYKGFGRPDTIAELITILYRRSGKNFIKDLRGSFWGVVADSGSDKVFAFNDRRGSRSFYIRQTNKGSYLLSDTVRAAAMFPPKLSAINDVGFAQYLIRGTYYGDQTIFDGIRKLPQASILEFERTHYRLETYWRYRIQTAESDSYRGAELVEECHELLRLSVRKLVSVLPNPVLFLSGGIDSRVVLGCLKEEFEGQISAITWGEAGGAEIETAAVLAAKCDVRHDVYEISIQDFPECFAEAVLAVDGRVDILDAPSLVRLWPELGKRFSGFFNGDECFGWRDRVSSVNEALQTIGWWNLDQTSRLASWFSPDFRNSIETGIREELDKLVSDADEFEPTNLKDKLYYQERLGNMLNGQLSAKLPFMEPAQPLVDEDVVDFITKIPSRLRYNKKLLRMVLEQKYPALAKLSISARQPLPSGAIISPAYVLKYPPTVEFLRTQLFESIDTRLEALLEMGYLRSCFEALSSGAPLPPMKGDLLRRLPLVWRIAPKRNNLVHPATGIFRVLGINLYLQSLQSGCL